MWTLLLKALCRLMVLHPPPPELCSSIMYRSRDIPCSPINGNPVLMFFFVRRRVIDINAIWLPNSIGRPAGRSAGLGARARSAAAPASQPAALTTLLTDEKTMICRLIMSKHMWLQSILLLSKAVGMAYNSDATYTTAEIINKMFNKVGFFNERKIEKFENNLWRAKFFDK